jgi:hypothetical protein
MGSNSDVFGTAMMKYNERKIYKKLQKTFPIPPSGLLDLRKILG